MKHSYLIPAIAGLICSMSAQTAIAADSGGHHDVITLDSRSSQHNYRPNEVIVKFKDSSRAKVRAASGKAQASGVSAVDNAFRALGVSRAEELMPLSGAETFPRRVRSYSGKEVAAPSYANAWLIEIDPSKSVSEAVEMLGAVADVEFAEPNYMVYALDTAGDDDINDPYYSVQYGIKAINLFNLWGMPVISKEGPVIAIIDTGVDISHPDLKANIWTNEAELRGASGYDDDRNGFTDDLHGWDFVNQTGLMADYNGHGTHCAGIAAAVGRNGLGIIGANHNARIMPLTAMQSNGTGDIATIIKAVDYAAANGAQVISMSLGTYSHSIALEQALGRAYQKAVIVAAAGNDGLCLNHPHPEKGQIAPMPMYPAAFTFVLGVQACGSNGSLAGFSNYDDDGPVFSPYSEEKLYNYELTVPGVGITSTYPNGQYKPLNGTSMATPLVAGAVSRLLQSKDYGNKEELFGDLINTVQSNGVMDIYAAYRISDANRTPSLQIIGNRMADADGDGRADAGEVLEFYPTIRNGWGNARNIRLTLDCAETANTFCEFLDTEASFGQSLSSYAKGESANPLRIRINDNVADGRVCRLRLTAEGDNASAVSQEFEIKVENGVELGGILHEDMTLHADQHYIVNTLFGVPEGVTLTIEPGTVIKFKDGSGITVDGNIVAKGEPGKMITFTKADLDQGDIYKFNLGNNEVEYCIIENFNAESSNIEVNSRNSVYRNNKSYSSIVSNFAKSNLYNLYGVNAGIQYPYVGISPTLHECNLTLNSQSGYTSPACFLRGRYISSSNIFSNFHGDDRLSLGYFAEIVGTYTPEFPNYLGTGDYNKARASVLDIYHKGSGSFGEYDLSNMLTRPVPEAHGIVWKVVVDGYDAQDEYDLLPPLGVGRHKFEVYFNRPMNKEKDPFVAMGVRAPYLQNAIGEDGHWRTEMLPFSPIGNVRGQTNVTNGDFQNGKNGWSVEGGQASSPSSSSSRNGFDGSYGRLYNIISGVTNKLYQKVVGAQNGRYKLTISAYVDKLAENNNCQYVYLNDTKVYLDEQALNGAVYEVTADVRDNEIEVGIAQTEKIASNLYIDNVSLTLLEEYSNERMVPTDIYTAWFTLTGKQNIDGVNRIYVAEAEDDEYFEIPVENQRFNVNVQCAGSLSTGFFGEAGLGRVNLTWEDLDMNFDDIMGYNMYRINPDSETPVMLNDRLIEAGTTAFTDYDVVPGKTYQYFYKVMTTALKENDPSKVIAVTPLTATLGDANGSGSVDVADVLTTVNYASGMNPKPFIFEAADMNADSEIDILDVVGIINTIMGRQDNSMLMALNEASLWISDGILYIDTPVDLAGLQFDFRFDGERHPIEVLESLDGFETTGAWQSEDVYRVMAYNLGGKTLAAGTHALLRIGDSALTDARLSDASGKNVDAVFTTQTGIDVADKDNLTVANSRPGVYNMLGVKVGERMADVDRLAPGVYIVNGWKVIKK